MALLFTRYLNIWIQGVAEQYGWDWRVELEGKAREELKIWKGWFTRWHTRPLWPEGEPEMLMAQGARKQKGLPEGERIPERLSNKHGRWVAGSKAALGYTADDAEDQLLVPNALRL